LWTDFDSGNGKSGALGRLHCSGHVLLPERGRSAAPASGNGTLQISLLIEQASKEKHGGLGLDFVGRDGGMD
jgi:hypothetical protein